MDILDNLRAWWKTPVGIPSDRPGDVAALEQRYGIRLPEDFRRYLLTACPDDYMMDDEVTIWWEIKNIKTVAESFENQPYDPNLDQIAERYLLFADYMFWFWGWAVCCDEGEHYGKIAFIPEKPSRFVANSFSDFVAKYLRDPDSVF